MDLTVQQPGGQRQQLTLDPKGFRTLSLDPQILLKTPEFRLETPGKGTVLYKVELTAPRTDIAAEGATHGIKVWKTDQKYRRHRRDQGRRSGESHGLCPGEGERPALSGPGRSSARGLGGGQHRLRHRGAKA